MAAIVVLTDGVSRPGPKPTVGRATFQCSAIRLQRSVRHHPGRLPMMVWQMTSPAAPGFPPLHVCTPFASPQIWRNKIIAIERLLHMKNSRRVRCLNAIMFSAADMIAIQPSRTRLEVLKFCLVRLLHSPPGDLLLHQRDCACRLSSEIGDMMLSDDWTRLLMTSTRLCPQIAWTEICQAHNHQDAKPKPPRDVCKRFPATHLEIHLLCSLSVPPRSCAILQPNRISDGDRGLPCC